MLLGNWTEAMRSAEQVCCCFINMIKKQLTYDSNSYGLNLNIDYILFQFQKVLMMDKKFLKAYIIKAEALFQICQFEHALLIFHRGQVSKSVLSVEMNYL